MGQKKINIWENFAILHIQVMWHIFMKMAFQQIC